MYLNYPQEENPNVLLLVYPETKRFDSVQSDYKSGCQNYTRFWYERTKKAVSKETMPGGNDAPSMWRLKAFGNSVFCLFFVFSTVVLLDAQLKSLFQRF